MKSIQAQLEELGLGEKEVKVYLASLELGSATVQQIAAKSAVVRASTYVAIGGLTKHGLMSTYTKGKKAYFTAEGPEHLLKLLKEKRKKLEEQESKLKEVMPELQALISLSADKPEVKYYEGLEGLDAMREMIFESKAKEILIIGTHQKVRRVVPETSRVLHSLKMKKAKIGGRYLLVTKSKNFKLGEVKDERWKYRTLSKFTESGSGEIAIFEDYISLISYQDKPYGFLVKSNDIALVAKVLFEGAWTGAQEPRLRD